MRHLLILILCFLTLQLLGQGEPSYEGGLKIKFNDDGSKYMRVLIWAQMQGVYSKK